MPNDPQGFLPPGVDDTTQLVIDLLFDPLYRLDENLTPQPALASAQPKVSSDGLSWIIPLANASFEDGKPVTAADAAYSLLLAASPNCTYSRDLCKAVADNLDTAGARGPRSLLITLNQPFGPFLTEVLAQVPIVERAAVERATDDIVSGARKIDQQEPRRTIDQITNTTEQDSCLSDAPPTGCKYSDYTTQLETLLSDANVALPPRSRFLTPTGDLDVEEYALSLLDRVASLDQVLTGVGIDQRAAALPILSAIGSPLGSGPYLLASYAPGDSLRFRANPGHVGGPPKIANVTLMIVRDPAAAATALLSGDADWDLRVDDSVASSIPTGKGVEVGTRPLQQQRTIVFNVRPGHVYSDLAARQAFAACLDLDTAAAAGGVTTNLAHTRTSADSWSMTAPIAVGTHDVTKATSLLQGAGYTKGTDGIYQKDGTRVSSSVEVRPSRADLVQFANEAARQLKECGIELQVKQLDLTGDLLVTQLLWPNDFDTVLTPRDLANDPDGDMINYETSHATSAENPADANAGGYSSPAADALIEQARGLVDLADRAPLYAQLQAQLAADVPDFPIWYDGATSAISSHVRTAGRPVDPRNPRFWWNIADWTLGAR